MDNINKEIDEKLLNRMFIKINLEERRNIREGRHGFSSMVNIIQKIIEEELK